MAIDLDHLRGWIGRSETDEDLIAPRHAQLMAATVGRSGQPLQTGDVLPPLWHWLYFLSGKPASELGRDGHPARGGFLPPVPLPNRMWAGGRVQFEAPLRLGAVARKTSTILAVEHKAGRSGDLVFVTVRHEIFDGSQRVLSEEQDLVYREPPPRAAPGVTAPPQDPPPAADHTQPWAPDSTQLFRYSALTFNGHRIHYDIDYCRDVEGYEGLIVHGPLSASLLAALAEQQLGRPLRRLAYRGVRPAIAGRPMSVNARREGEGLALWTALADGAVSMQAEAA